MIGRAPSSCNFLSDLPDEAAALVAVSDRRLLDELFFELAVAIAGIVALGPAGVILEELLVGIVDTAAGDVDADLVVFAGHFLGNQFAVSTGSSSPSVRPNLSL